MATHFRRKIKTWENLRDPFLLRINKSATGTVRRAELGNFIDSFKAYILRNLSEQIDTLKIKNKQKLENVALSIFCPM